jgi:putative zinc finger/helix-turn-helix YgiT family protein
MMSEKIPQSGKDRPFPWRCVECGLDSIIPVATDYTTTVKHDGRPYTIHIPNLAIPTCPQCGKQLFTAQVDDQITAKLRADIDLLTPDEIKAQRQRLGLNQEELADQLGTAKGTISRWETGALIQSRAMDNLLRLYFDSEDARERLGRRFKPIVVNRIKWKRPGLEDLYAHVRFEAFLRN